MIYRLYLFLILQLLVLLLLPVLLKMRKLSLWLRPFLVVYYWLVLSLLLALVLLSMPDGRLNVAIVNQLS